MPTLTLFEHQHYPYEELGWRLDHPAVERLERLNEVSGVELVRIGRKGLRPTQFVGVIRVGEATLQILPKIDYNGITDAPLGSVAQLDAADTATRNLLHMLSYTHDITIQEQAVASLRSSQCDWFELLTRLFAGNLHRLLKQGLEHSYVVVEDMLPVLRGKWQFGRQLTTRPYVRHLFDVSYDEFTPDTPLNRVLRFVSDQLLLHSQETGNRRLLRDIGNWLVSVELLGRVEEAHLNSVQFTRFNEQFRPVFNLARLFLEGSTPQVVSGDHRTFAFVFDMNRLFEEFIAKFICRHRKRVLPAEWDDRAIVVKTEGKSVYLAEDLQTDAPAFRLIPDVLLKLAGRTLLILDTKYKQLDTQSHHYGITESDIYQMIAYATGLGCPRVLMLYPQSRGRGLVRAEFRCHGSAIHVAAATVDLHTPLNDPKGVMRQLTDILRVSLASAILEVEKHGQTFSG